MTDPSSYPSSDPSSDPSLFSLYSTCVRQTLYPLLFFNLGQNQICKLSEDASSEECSRQLNHLISQIVKCAPSNITITYSLNERGLIDGLLRVTRKYISTREGTIGNSEYEKMYFNFSNGFLTNKLDSPNNVCASVIKYDHNDKVIELNIYYENGTGIMFKDNNVYAMIILKYIKSMILEEKINNPVWKLSDFMPNDI